MTVIRTDNQTLCVSPCTADTSRYLMLASGTAAEYTTSGAGDTTTVACSTLTDANDTHVGRVVEFLSGTNEGLMVFCTDSASGSLTVETMPSAPGSGARFRILANTFSTTIASAGSTTEWTDTDINDADDYWNHFQVRPIKATESITDEMAIVTDFVQSTGVFTVATFDATVTAGDVAILERPLLAEDLSVEHPVDMIERNPIRNTNVPEQSIAGARRGGTVSFSLPVKGDNTGAGDGVTWTRSNDCLALLESCFGALTLDTGDTDQAGGNATVIAVSDGTRFTAGCPVMINGEVRTIASISGNNVTLESALSDAPASGDVVYGAASVRYASTGHYPVNFEYWEDQILYRFFSCQGTVTFSTDAAGRLMANFSFQAQSWSSLNQACPVTKIHTKYPARDVEDIIARDTPVRFDTTEVEVATYSVDPALQVSARPATGGIEGSKAFLVTGCKPTFSCNPVKENHTYDLAVRKQSTYDHGAQFSSKPGNAFFSWMPKVQLTSNGSEDAEGYKRNTIAGKAVVPASTDPLGEGIVISFL